MRTWTFLIALPLLAGCAVTVNGKTYNSFSEALKGSNDPQQPPAAQPPANTSATTASAPAAAPAPVAGKTVTLDPARAPNPLVIDVGAAPTSVSSIHGYAQCNNSDSYMTEAPVARIVVTQKTKLRLLSKQAGLITLPGNRFRCYEHKTIGPTGLIYVHEGEYEAGTYDVYAMGRQGQQVATHLELIIVDRVPQDVAARLDAAPVLEAKVQGTLNPVYLSVDGPGAPVFREHLKLDCAQSPQVRPVARLKVTDASTWWLDADQREVYLRGPDGQCRRGGGDLPRGLYDLFVASYDSLRPSFDLALVDGERALSLGDAPHVAVGDLKQPVPVPVTIPEPAFRTRSLCGTGARTPSFYLDVKQPREDVSLRTLVADADVEWTVAGPLELVKPSSEWCTSSGHGRHFQKLEKGTYAVWVSSRAGVGQRAYALLHGNFEDRVADRKAEGEPLAKLAPIPAELALKDRQVWWHYPYYPRETKAVEALFLDAPPQLFVFLTSDADQVKAGEPLLLARWGQDKSTVLRANGETREVRTERLSTDKPQQVVLPSDWPELQKPNDVKEGYGIASPVDLQKFAQWENADAKRNACVGDWMSKHDPTWGKNYELVNLRTGETVTDQKFRQADQVCNSTSVEAAAKALVRDAYQSRLSQREKLKKTLMARLR